MRKRVISALLLVLFAAQAAQSAVVFVDAAAPDGGDGTTWGTAFTSIQDGIDDAVAGDGVFVKAGTYAESVVLKSGVALLGGFAGTETLPEERDLGANETIVDVSTLPRPVRALLLDGVSNVQVDALTIRGGDVDAPGGGGMYVEGAGANTVVSNCRFVNNATSQDGGGVLVVDTSIALLTCEFEGNNANTGGGLKLLNASGVVLAGARFVDNRANSFGGGLSQQNGSATIENSLFQGNSCREGGGVHGFNATATFTGCSFIDNNAPDFGGGLSWYGAPVTVRRCLFVGNTASVRGGAGMEIHETDATISDCLFTQNVATGDGGAIRFDVGNFEVTNCTVAGNSASTSGGGIVVIRGALRVRNTIVANNTANGLQGLDGTLLLSNNLFDTNSPADVDDAAAGPLSGAEAINAGIVGATDNVAGDPGFANAAALDFHLLGVSAAIGRASAIYATSTDLDGLPRPGDDGIPDIGAYEFYDEVPPTVLSITRASVTPTNAATVQFVVRFDEAVVGVGANDFQISSADLKAVTGASVTNVQGERNQYLVTVNTGTGDGTLRLDLIDNDSILDLGDNLLGGPGIGNGSFTTGESFEIDKTAPVLTLIGDAALTLEAGSFYVEPGVTADDNRDGDITNRIAAAGFVDIGELGSYTIDYSVSDTAGNAAATLSRTVTVVDTIAPVIQLFGENPITISYGTPYEDAGGFAFDAYDGDVSSQLEFIPPTGEFGLPGNYEFIFRVADSSGNVAESIRAITIVDDTAPVITILGEARVEVGLGQPYEDAGATATDNVDGDITDRITVASDLTTAFPGEYPVVYSVSDTAGNEAEAVRIVAVLDRPDFYVTPEVQFISSFARTVVFDVYNRSTASQPWKAEVIEGGSWCEIVAGDTGELFYGQIFARTEDNTSAERRVAKIQISTAEKFALPLIVQISQAPTPKGALGCGGSAPQSSPWGDFTVVALLAAALAWRARKGSGQHG